MSLPAYQAWPCLLSRALPTRSWYRIIYKYFCVSASPPQPSALSPQPLRMDFSRLSPPFRFPLDNPVQILYFSTSGSASFTTSVSEAECGAVTTLSACSALNMLSFAIDIMPCFFLPPPLPPLLELPFLPPPFFCAQPAQPTPPFFVSSIGFKCVVSAPTVSDRNIENPVCVTFGDAWALLAPVAGVDTFNSGFFELVAFLVFFFVFPPPFFFSTSSSPVSLR